MSIVTAEIGVLGGSGFYTMEGLQDVKEIQVETPFGFPSEKIVVGTLEGVRVAFLARHGVGHKFLPHEIPFKANIYAMKSLGVKWLISVSACGSLREHLAPGDMAVPDGLFDRTMGRRDATFLGGGLVGHVSLADPFCPVLADDLARAAERSIPAGRKVHRGGSLVVIGGPRFSTKTESRVFRQWGLDLINMTTLPEASLAREAEMSYAVLNLVTDYDCWHVSEEAVTVEHVIRVLMGNVAAAQNTIREAVKLLHQETRVSPAWSALKDALMTPPAMVPAQTRRDLALLLDKYWGPAAAAK